MDLSNLLRACATDHQLRTPASSDRRPSQGSDPPSGQPFGSPNRGKTSNVVKVVTSAAARAKTLQHESVQPVVDQLFTRVATVNMFNSLLPAIKGCSSAAQLSAVLTSATTTFMQGPEEAIDVL